MEPFYERVEHTADLALRVWGRDLRELFARAAAALFALMAEPPAAEDRARQLALESTDIEALLVDWLNEMIFLHEVERESYSRFVIAELTGERLRATIHGGPTTRKLRVIKAATFHDLAIRETPEGVEAHLVFDV